MDASSSSHSLVPPGSSNPSSVSPSSNQAQQGSVGSSGSSSTQVNLRVNQLGSKITQNSNGDEDENENLDFTATRGDSQNFQNVNGKMSSIAGQQNLTPQLTVKPVHPAPIKLDEATEIARIEKLAKEDPSKVGSSQMILNDFIKTFKNLKYEDIKLSSNLEQDTVGSGGKKPYKVQAYTLDSDPPKTCYRIKVEYKVEAKDLNGDLKEISFSRTISTTATSPADAVLIASQFKKRVEEYATLDTNLEDPSVKARGDFNTTAMSSKTFSFSFERNDAGGLTHLSAIRVMKDDKDKTVLEHKIPLDPTKANSYGYNLKNSEIIVGNQEAPGHVFFETEEQRSVHHNGVITLNRDYEDLELDEGALEKEAQTLQDEIKKKQGQFEEIKGTFLKDPFLKFIRKNAEPTLSPEFTELAENVSSDMAQFINKKKEIEEIKAEQEKAGKDLGLLDKLKAKLKKNNKAASKGLPPPNPESIELIAQIQKDYNISADQLDKKTPGEIITNCKNAIQDRQTELEKSVMDCENELNSLGAIISNQQKTFHQQLGELYKINQELKFQFDQLKNLHKKASLVKLDSLFITDEKKAQAKAFLKLVPNEMIDKLEKQLASQGAAIQKILDRLEKLTTESTSSAEPLDASDGL